MKDDSSREKILKAAEELFAETGFDKTSTASIAKRAGVNSALIFYYFESKENLLKNIMNEKFLSYRHDRIHTIPEIGDMCNGKMSISLLDEMIQDGLKFMRQSENLFRILTMETLKKTSGGFEVFQITETLLNDILKEIGQPGDEVKDKLTLEIRNFFFITLPMVMFIMLQSKMQDYYQVTAEELTAKMTAAVKDAYIHLFAKELDIEITN